MKVWFIVYDFYLDVNFESMSHVSLHKFCDVIIASKIPLNV